MNDGEGIWGAIFVGLMIWGLGSWFGWWGPSNEDKLRTALQEANSQIDYCNQQIESAKNEVWQDYNTMGYAIDDMNYCDTVLDPTKK